MQAVILAAGRGTRMGDLTIATPKPLLFSSGKTLLEYKLDVLSDLVDEVIIIVGYLETKIRETLGTSYQGVPIQYVTQEKLNGTAGALYSAKHLLSDDFLVMMGDDLYAKEDIIECVKHPWAVSVKEREEVEMGGEMLLDGRGNFIGINEQKHFVEKGYINTGLYKLQKSFFDYKMMPVSGTSEFGLPQTLMVCAKDHPVKVVISDFPWKQVSCPEDLM